ncbi:MAG TPA: hypothetical protein VIX86_24300 [Streptosporangiaceae bacterium]
MASPDLAQRPAGPARGRPDLIRRISLGMMIGLLLEYGLGMAVNLYLSVPRQDRGAGLVTAAGRALANGPVALSVHAGLGLLLILGALNLLIRAIVSGQRPAAWLSGVAFLAIAGAAAAGASFVGSGRPGASLAMALLTAVALLCYAGNLFLASFRR